MWLFVFGWISIQATTHQYHYFIGYNSAVFPSEHSLSHSSVFSGYQLSLWFLLNKIFNPDWCKIKQKTGYHLTIQKSDRNLVFETSLNIRLTFSCQKLSSLFSSSDNEVEGRNFLDCNGCSYIRLSSNYFLYILLDFRAFYHIYY